MCIVNVQHAISSMPPSVLRSTPLSVRTVMNEDWKPAFSNQACGNGCATLYSSSSHAAPEQDVTTYSRRDRKTDFVNQTQRRAASTASHNSQQARYTESTAERVEWRTEDGAQLRASLQAPMAAFWKRASGRGRAGIQPQGDTNMATMHEQQWNPCVHEYIHPCQGEAFFSCIKCSQSLFLLLA